MANKAIRQNPTGAKPPNARALAHHNNGPDNGNDIEPRQLVSPRSIDPEMIDCYAEALSK